MLPNTTASVSVKSSLSMLLMRTWEQLEDPKYATVPQTHWDEVRPSILQKYKDNIEDAHSNVNNDDDNFCSAMRCDSSSKRISKCCSKAATLHAFNWNIEPLWRYCASQIQLDFNDSGRAAFQVEKTTSEYTNKITNGIKKSTTQIPTTSTSSCNKSSSKKFKWLKLKSKKPKMEKIPISSEILKKSSPNETEKSAWHCSQAAFEVLPPLYENCDHSLLYQNSYLLDGVRYEYEPVRPTQQHCVGTKLRLNYIKFLKSVNSTKKPTDQEIIFGNAKIITIPPPHWEGARIDWLLNLERKQELRKIRCAEQQEQLKQTRENIKLAMKKIKVNGEHQEKSEKKCKNAEKKRHKKKFDKKSQSPSQSTDGNVCTCFPIAN